MTEENEEMLHLNLRLPRSLWHRLAACALQRETTRTSICENALMGMLRRLETSQEQKIILSDKLLDRFIEDGFNLDDEENFVAKMKATGHSLNELTPEQWKRVLNAIKEENESMVSEIDPRQLRKSLLELQPSQEQAIEINELPAWLEKKEEEPDSEENQEADSEEEE
jgi:hypothetical protein